MGKNRKIAFILTAISGIIGIMLAVQLQSNLQPRVPESRSITELRSSLQSELEKRKNLLSDISKLDQLLYQYETSLDDDESLTVMLEELARARKLAGLVSAEGPGVIIRIVDRSPLNPPSEPLEMGSVPHNVVVDEDLRWLVNELKANGAVAVSINGHRLISTSSIRNVGEEIQIDTKFISPPYEVIALGDPDVLVSGLKLAGVEKNFALANKVVHMEKRDNVTVPAFQGNRTVQHMKPVKDKGDS